MQLNLHFIFFQLFYAYFAVYTKGRAVIQLTLYEAIIQYEIKQVCVCIQDNVITEYYDKLVSIMNM